MKGKVIDIVISTVTTVIIVSVVMAASSHFREVDKPAVEAMAPTGQRDSAGSIAIPGYEKLIMRAGQVEQIVDFYNPEENECYIRISLILKNGAELFSSGMIKPGQRINKIEISRPLKAGTYRDTALRYDCYTLEGLQPLNGSETVLNLEVLP